MVENTSSTAPRSPRAVVSCPFCGKLNRVALDRVEDRPRCGKCGRPLLLDRPVPVTDADFRRVVAGSDVPVLLDVYADWCGPCRAMAPVFDELAADRAGEILVVKLDSDRNPTTATELGIRGIPTSIVFVAGREAARQTGAVGRPGLDDLLARASEDRPGG
jgi:thioredoxin 2